jgi:hypothetical protein
MKNNENEREEIDYLFSKEVEKIYLESTIKADHFMPNPSGEGEL